MHQQYHGKRCKYDKVDQTNASLYESRGVLGQTHIIVAKYCLGFINFIVTYIVKLGTPI